MVQFEVQEPESQAVFLVPGNQPRQPTPPKYDWRTIRLGRYSRPELEARLTAGPRSTIARTADPRLVSKLQQDARFFYECQKSHVRTAPLRLSAHRLPRPEGQTWSDAQARDEYVRLCKELRINPSNLGRIRREPGTLEMQHLHFNYQTEAVACHVREEFHKSAPQSARRHGRNGGRTLRGLSEMGRSPGSARRPTADDLAEVVAAKVEAGELGRQISKVLLRENGLTDLGACHLLNALPSTITELNLGDNRLHEVSPWAGMGLLKALRRFTGLKQLVLANNQLQDTMVDQLCTDLELCRGLTKLDLSGNKIHRGGIGAGRLISSHPNLEVLNLQWNSLGGSPAVAIAKGLLDNGLSGRLRWVDLSWNSIAEPIHQSDAGYFKTDGRSQLYLPPVPTFVSAAEENHGGGLFLPPTHQVSRPLMGDPAAGKGSEFCRCLKQVLQQNSNLVHVSLAHNDLTLSDCQELDEGLRSNTTLQGLHMHGNAAQLGVDGALDLRQHERAAREKRRRRAQWEQDQRQLRHSKPGKQQLEATIARALQTLGADQTDTMLDQTKQGSVGEEHPGCWVCGRWQEVRICYTPGVSSPSSETDVKVYRSTDSYRSATQLVPTASGDLVAWVMAPVGMMTFVFQVGNEFLASETSQQQYSPPDLVLEVVGAPAEPAKEAAKEEAGEGEEEGEEEGEQAEQVAVVEEIVPLWCWEQVCDCGRTVPWIPGKPGQCSFSEEVHVSWNATEELTEAGTTPCPDWVKAKSHPWIVRAQEGAKVNTLLVVPPAEDDPGTPDAALALQVVRPRAAQATLVDQAPKTWNIEASFFASTIFVEELERPLNRAFETDWYTSRVAYLVGSLDERAVPKLREMFWLFYEPIVLLYIGFCTFDPSGSSSLGLSTFTAAALLVKHGVLAVGATATGTSLQLGDADALFFLCATAPAVDGATDLCCCRHMLHRYAMFEYLMRVSDLAYRDSSPDVAVASLLERHVQAGMDDYIRAYTQWRTEVFQTEAVEKACRDHLPLLRQWYGRGVTPVEWKQLCMTTGLLKSSAQSLNDWDQAWCFKFSQIPHSNEVLQTNFRTLTIAEFAECLTRAVLLDKCVVDLAAPSDPSSRFAEGAPYESEAVAEALREFCRKLS